MTSEKSERRKVERVRKRKRDYGTAPRGRASNINRPRDEGRRASPTEALPIERADGDRRGGDVTWSSLKGICTPH